MVRPRMIWHLCVEIPLYLPFASFVQIFVSGSIHYKINQCPHHPMSKQPFFATAILKPGWSSDPMSASLKIQARGCRMAQYAGAQASAFYRTHLLML